MKPLKYWNSEGFEISPFKFQLSNKINKSFRTSGSDHTGFNAYTYNELGFRGDSIKKEGFKVMSLGCSITEGVGVNDDETWPHQLCKFIPNAVNLNFGMGGRSNDTICRCLISYYDLIKPDLVLIMYTFPHRREIYTEDGGIEPYMPNKVWNKLSQTNEESIIQNSLDILQNDNEDLINWYKNHILIKLFLESKNCNWLWDGNNLRTNYTEFNRFTLMDNFKIIDLGSDNIHPGPKHHDHYGRILYSYIYKNFRSYLPENTQSVKTTLI